MYNTLARYYDTFMNSVDYDGWIKYVRSFLGARRDGADLACGSGKFTIGLIKAGYNVYGADISPQMLETAKANARKECVKAEFLLGDMETFSFIRPPEFVTAMCDAVNYLKEPLKAFRNIFRGLKKGGVFVFDVSSEYKLTEILGDNTYSDASGDITYIWNNFLDKNRRKVDMELTFFEKTDGGLYKKSVETQSQYIHKTGDLKEKLYAAGFTDVITDDSMRPNGEKNGAERIHFIAYK